MSYPDEMRSYAAPKISVSMTITVEGATPAQARQILESYRFQDPETRIYGTVQPGAPSISNTINQALGRACCDGLKGSGKEATE